MTHSRSSARSLSVDRLPTGSLGVWNAGRDGCSHWSASTVYDDRFLSGMSEVHGEPVS